MFLPHLLQKEMLLRLILYCEVYFCTINIVIFLDFHSTKHGLQWLILGHVALTKIKYIPIELHYSTLSKHGGKWRVRKREKHRQVLPVFFAVNE